MQICIKRIAARNISVIYIAVSTFVALTVDGYSFMNSGWLCAIIGFVIAVPVAIAADKSHSFTVVGNGAISKVCLFIIAAYMIYRSAMFLRLIVNSVSYSNLQMLSPALLSVVVCLVGLYGIMKNGRGFGNAMKLWILAFCILFAVILAASIGDMRPGWLTPVFGPGIPKIIEGSIIAAGHILTGMLLAAVSEDRKMYDCTKTVIFGGIAACLLCIYWSLMTPLQLSGHYNRLSGIETLLSNGRSSLLVLLPTTVMWFMGIIAAFAGAGFSGALFLQKICNRFKKIYIAAAVLIAAFLTASFGLAESDSSEMVSKYALAALIIVLIIEKLAGRKLADEN